MPHSRCLYKKSLPCLALLWLVPAVAHAHVKWFVPLDEASVPIAAFGVADAAVRLWLVIALVLVGASLWLDRMLPAPPQPRESWRAPIARILPVLTGLSLLLSTEAGSVIAPHFHWDGSFAQSLLVLQGLTGLLLLFPSTIAAGALTLLALYLGLCFKAGILAALEYFNIAGIAAFLFIAFHPVPRLRAWLEPWALPLLRVCTGIALVTLGLTEKVLHPGYAEDFLQTYMWNFMYNLGVENYSDRLFVLSAGMMEIVFGVILILGTTTRLNIIAVSGFMLASNFTFLFEGHLREAATEIVGHMPLMATALLLVLFGSGSRLRVSKLFRPLPAARSSEVEEIDIDMRSDQRPQVAPPQV